MDERFKVQGATYIRQRAGKLERYSSHERTKVREYEWTAPMRSAEFGMRNPCEMRNTQRVPEHPKGTRMRND